MRRQTAEVVPGEMRKTTVVPCQGADSSAGSSSATPMETEATMLDAASPLVSAPKAMPSAGGDGDPNESEEGLPDLIAAGDTSSSSCSPTRSMLVFLVCVAVYHEDLTRIETRVEV